MMERQVTNWECNYCGDVAGPDHSREACQETLLRQRNEARQERDLRHRVAWQFKVFLGQSIHAEDRSYAGAMTQKHEWLCDPPAAEPTGGGGDR